MRVLVTGTEGYLGSLLAPILLQKGHEVLGVDTGFYKAGWLYNSATPTPKTLAKDIRRLEPQELEGLDAVVHMAELSNDPTGELAPHITYEINHRGSVRLAQLARAAGVRRFIYMSSCSVYGVAGDADVTEESPVKPQTAYAVCKTLVEKDLKEMADKNFSPVVFRNATAFGASPRQRFDLVVNNLCGLAWTTHELKMSSDGTPWRPLVHGLDICRAIACALDAPAEAIHNEMFNIGDTKQNYRIREIAEIIGKVFTGCSVTFGANGSDNRSYRVSFEKAARSLPGFRCEWDVEKGVRQFHALFQRIDLSPEIFNHRGFTRLKQLEYLIRTQQIDKDFYWATNF
jgi:nucleoside-diphosphate-sugar epimerase